MSACPAEFVADATNGVSTDIELAKKYGVCRQTVYRWRKSLGIPSCYDRRLSVKEALEQLVQAVENWRQAVPPAVGGALRDAKNSLKGVSGERSDQSERQGRPTVDA